MAEIAFDEAGNTGANLLDPAQPCFALASVHLREPDARTILSALPKSNASEAHFKDLRRSGAGRDGIVEALSSPLLTPSTAKVFLVHKPFMVITKIVDLLVENLAFRDGVDLYEQGANIALANLLHYCVPAFCSPEALHRIQLSFVAMIREKTNSSITAFYTAVAAARAECRDSDFAMQLDTITASRSILREHLEDWRHTELDPAVPCLIDLARQWSDQLNGTFGILHDRSKPIAFEQDFIEALMDPDGSDERVGRDRRNAPLFIRATGIKLVDSKKVPQVQVADLLAGAATMIGLGLLGKAADQEFQHALHDKLFETLVAGMIWPVPSVSPKDLGTDTPFRGADELRTGQEIAKRIYIDSSGRPRRR